MPRLLNGEQAILTARQHWLVIVPALLAHLIALIVAMVLLAILPGATSGSVHTVVNDWINLVRILVVLGLGLSALYRWMEWKGRTYLLTNQRIVVSRGVVNKLITSVSLDRVQDVIVHQGLWQRLVHCGDIEIESAGRDGTEVMRLIPDPQGFANTLLQAIEAHRQGRPYPGLPATDDGLGGGAPPQQGWQPVPPGRPRDAAYGTGAVPAAYPAQPSGYQQQPPVLRPQPDYRSVPAYGEPQQPPGYPPEPPPPDPVQPPPRQGYQDPERR